MWLRISEASGWKADKAGTIRYKQIGPVTPEALEQKILPLVKELNS